MNRSPAGMSPCLGAGSQGRAGSRSEPHQLLAARRSARASIRRSTARATADVVIIGGGFTGLWTAIALTDTDPALRVDRPRGGDRRLRGERAERRLLRGVADPRPGQRDPPLPRRAGAARGRGRGQSARASIDVHARRTASTATSRRPARSPWPTSRTRSTSSGPGSTRPPSTARTLEFLDRDRVRDRGPLPALAGRPATGRPAATSCSTRPSCAAASPASPRERGVRIHERTRVDAPRAASPAGSSCRTGERRHDPGRPGRRRDVGLLRLAAPAAAAVRAGLRLRPRLRAADARRAGVDRLGRGARACPTPTTSSTTSG